MGRYAGSERPDTASHDRGLATKKPRPLSGRGFQPGDGRFQDLGADAAAAGTSVLGGLLAVPGGECAPAASAGLAAGGV